MKDLNIIKHEKLNLPWIEYGFSTRLNGESNYPWGGLNCSNFVGDFKSKVENNRKKFLGKLKLPSAIQLNQVHGNNVVIAEKIKGLKDKVSADGIISSKNNLSISITTADCAPILFVSLNNKIVGAAHAGWKGAFLGITDNLLEKLIENGSLPEQIICIIGPCIGPDSYEVDYNFFNKALELDKFSKVYFIKKNNNKYLFNLPGYIKYRIKAKGVNKIYWTGHDTYKNPELFYSYRYSCHFGNGITGRMMSVISIK